MTSFYNLEVEKSFLNMTLQDETMKGNKDIFDLQKNSDKNKRTKNKLGKDIFKKQKKGASVIWSIILSLSSAS